MNEDWLRERMERHRNPSGAWDQLTVDGQWLRIEERRMSDGGIVVVRSDVTDLKNREREFAEKSALLEATLQNMGEGISVYGPDLKMVFRSKVSAELLELPAEVLPPSVQFEAVMRFRAGRGDFGEGDIEFRRSPFAWPGSGRRRPWSEMRRRRDGRVIETRFSPMPDGGGVFMFRDVTELADREAKLAEKTALLEATLQNMGEGLAAFDAERRLLIINDFALGMAHLPPELTKPGVSYDDMLRALAATDALRQPQRRVLRRPRRRSVPGAKAVPHRLAPQQRPRTRDSLHADTGRRRRLHLLATSPSASPTRRSSQKDRPARGDAGEHGRGDRGLRAGPQTPDVQ